MIKQELMLELSSRCNLNCKMCAFKSGFTGMEMSKKHVLDILSDIPIINKNSEFYCIDSIRLDGNTEPLMYKDLDFVINEGRKVGIEHFYIVSNGVLLTKEKSKSLLEADVASIDISMTGIIPDVYKNFQGYGLTKEGCRKQIDLIIDNIKEFVELRNKLKKKTTITMRYIVSKDSSCHFADYVNFFRTINVDAIMAMTLTTNELHSKCYPLGKIIERKKCDSPNHPVVCANGDVLLSNCQYDIPTLGNAFETGFANVMLSEKTEKYLYGFRALRMDMIPINCRNCHNTHIYEGVKQ